MDQFSADLSSTLEQVLRNPPNDLLPLKECISTLTTPPPSSSPVCDEDHAHSTDNGSLTGLSILTGYPRYPLYKRLTQSLCYWANTGNCPVFELPVMYLLNEESSVERRQRRMDDITPRLTGAPSLWDCWSDDEKKYFVIEILKMLGVRGILDLLGLRETVGSSSELMPPPMETLLQTFTKPHCPPSKLTVGARALAKHHHRDNTESWWGNCTGSEEQKNSHAYKLILKIMDNATWINIHSLPHDVKVVEIRTVEGYGARWALDGTEFRGFLEPQMTDGHEVGWRH